MGRMTKSCIFATILIRRPVCVTPPVPQTPWGPDKENPRPQPLPGKMNGERKAKLGVAGGFAYAEKITIAHSGITIPRKCNGRVGVFCGAHSLSRSYIHVES